MKEKGFYKQGLVTDKKVSAYKYKTWATNKVNMSPNYADFSELDQHYWNQLDKSVVLYGSDVHATFFDESCKIWNLNKLPNILQETIENDYDMVNFLRFFNVYSYSFNPESMFPKKFGLCLSGISSNNFNNKTFFFHSIIKHASHFYSLGIRWDYEPILVLNSW